MNIYLFILLIIYKATYMGSLLKFKFLEITGLMIWYMLQNLEWCKYGACLWWFAVDFAVCLSASYIMYHSLIKVFLSLQHIGSLKVWENVVLVMEVVSYCIFTCQCQLVDIILLIWLGHISIFNTSSLFFSSSLYVHLFVSEGVCRNSLAFCCFQILKWRFRQDPVLRQMR